jgi:hypothetical protein
MSVRWALPIVCSTFDTHRISRAGSTAVFRWLVITILIGFVLLICFKIRSPFLGVVTIQCEQRMPHRPVHVFPPFCRVFPTRVGSLHCRRSLLCNNDKRGHCWNTLLRNNYLVSYKCKNGLRMSLVQQWPSWCEVKNNSGMQVYSKEYTFTSLFFWGSTITTKPFCIFSIHQDNGAVSSVLLVF